MKILVTGGAGYVGTRLCNMLAKLGHTVCAFDTMTYVNPNKDGLLLNVIEFQGDITSLDDLRRAFQAASGFDVIYHLAAISNDPTGDLDEGVTEKVNYIGSMNVLRVAQEFKAKQFIFASSSSVFGIQEGENITEEVTPAPITIYSKTKLRAENNIIAAASDDFITTSIRPATICGVSPRQRFDLAMNNLVGMAFFDNHITINGGEQRRPNLTMETMLEIYLKLIDPELDKSLINSQVFNAGWENMKIKEMAKIAAEVVPFTIEELTGKHISTIDITVKPVIDQRDYHITSKKIEKVLGIRPNHKLLDAAKDLIKVMYWGFVPDMTEDIYYNLKVLKKDNG